MTYFPSLSFRASMRGLAAAACLSLSGLGLSACSGQDGPVIEHKGAAPAEPSQTPQTPETPQSSEPAPLAAAELAAIQAMTIPELMSTATLDANKLADVLAAVSDEATARAALLKMQAMGPKIEAMAMQIDRGLEAGEIKLSLKTMNDMADFAKAQMRMVGEMGGVLERHPELRSLITEELEGLEIKIE